MSTEEIILWVALLLPGSANCQFAASFFKALQLTGTLEAWPPILWVVSLLPRSANCQFAASFFKVLQLTGILEASPPTCGSSRSYLVAQTVCLRHPFSKYSN